MSADIRYCDPLAGDDDADGSVVSPWRTLRRAVSVGTLGPGSTLVLRPGRYLELQDWYDDWYKSPKKDPRGAPTIWAPLRGSADHPIVVRAESSQKPVIDFTWHTPTLSPKDEEGYLFESQELLVPEKWDDLRVSGLFGDGRRTWGLVSYQHAFDFESKEHKAGRGLNETQYVGPGAYVKDLGTKDAPEGARLVRIRVRVEPPDKCAVGDDASFSRIDPAQLRISLTVRGTRRGSALWALAAGANYGVMRHTRFQGLTFYNAAGVALRSALQYVELDDVDFILSGGGLAVDHPSYEVRIRGCGFDGNLPPWISWCDVKSARKLPGKPEAPPIAGSMGARGITVAGGGSHSFSVSASSFTRLFDAVYVEGGDNIRISGSTFRSIRDDSIQIAVGVTDVEVDGNTLVDTATAVPGMGGRVPAGRAAGTVYIHHNRARLSPVLKDRPQQSAVRAPGSNVPLWNKIWHAHTNPFFIHGDDASYFGKPGNRADTIARKVYRNTIVSETSYKQPLPITVPTPARRSARAAIRPEARPWSATEVYNNIFIVLGNTPFVSRVEAQFGNLILDGNAYIRVWEAATGAKEAREKAVGFWDIDRKYHQYESWQEFRSGEHLELTQRYYGPGWEDSVWEAELEEAASLDRALEELGLDSSFRPLELKEALSGGIALPRHWPGDTDGRYRGAVEVADLE